MSEVLDLTERAPTTSRRLGVRQRLGILVVLLVLLISFVLALRSYLVDTALIRESTISRAEQLAKVIAAGCARPMLAGELESVRAAARAAQIQGVSWIRVSAPSGKIVADGRPDPNSADVDAEEADSSADHMIQDPADLVTSSARIEIGARWIGTVDVAISVEKANRQLAALRLEHIGVTAILAALAFALVSRLLGQALRPLTELSHATRQVASGSFDVRVPEVGGDEVGALAGSFNDMAEALCATVVSREALAAANLQLDEARRAAEASDQAKSEFLANMSHEIRTPMTAILGFAEVLLENPSAADVADSARTIHANGNHLLSILDDILDLSKVEAGRMTIERLRCSPVELVRDVHSLMRVRAASKNLGLMVTWRAPIPETIESDPTRLRQVLVNLVGNAVKFTETGHIRIVVGLARDGRADRLEVEVIDTGIGMTAEQIDRIFDPFAQGDERTTRRFGGTGLGLSISRRLMKLLGGDIRVHSEPGAGSRFVVSVPTGNMSGVRLIADPEASDSAPSVAPRVSASANRPLDGLRLLLAEDGHDNQRLISFLMRKLGAVVEIADNGRVAAEMASASLEEGRPYDVILMDMHMPEMDGYTATRTLRDRGYSHPIVALTAAAMEGDERRCRDAGCDAYTTKPIQREQLVRAILDSCRAEQAVND
ncbi:MAG: ATP-binding protein [Planctomycetota bacterium]